MFIDVSKPLIPQSLELGQSRDATNATLGNVEKYLTGQLIFFGAAESTDTSPQVCWRSDITAQLCEPYRVSFEFCFSMALVTSQVVISDTPVLISFTGTTEEALVSSISFPAMISNSHNLKHAYMFWHCHPGWANARLHVLSLLATLHSSPPRVGGVIPETRRLWYSVPLRARSEMKTQMFCYTQFEKSIDTN